MSGSQGLGTVGQVWRSVQARLEATREVAPTEGKQLVRHVLGMDEVALVMGEKAPFPADKVEILDQLVERRTAGEPLAQVLGFAWFYGRRWAVGPEVLIPRPDTEVLVDEVLKRLDVGVRVVEIGVGSGCVMGTLLAERADILVTGVEISEAAAALAKCNVAALDVAPERWEIIVGDGLEDVEGRFNLIVSNPPYVADEEWEKLEDEVKEFEPKLALTGGVPNPDGLMFYRRLAGWGSDKLMPGGWLCMETGWQQAQAVRKLLEEQGDDLWCEISVTKDLGGRERVVCARRC